MTLPQINQEIINQDIGYAVERGSISIQEAEQMSWSEKMQWLDRYNYDYDPY